jgi:integrase/recombinase XerD
MKDPRNNKRIIRQRQFAPQALQHPLDYYFDIFLRAKKAEGLRERTINDHHRHYKYFRDWLFVNFPILSIEELTADHIRQYIHYMLSERQQFQGHPSRGKNSKTIGLSPATVNIRTRTLRCFLKFLFTEDYIKKDISKSIKMQRIEEDTIGGFSKEEMLALLSAPNQREYVGFRDYVLMLFLFDTGMRINEALHVTSENVNFTDRLIIIPASLSKNRKSRSIPMSLKTSDLLHELHKENQVNFGEGVDYFFLSNYGEQLKHRQAHARIQRYGKQANIQDTRVSPHTFRHTFATFYMRNGGDPFSLQKILGHSTMDMVRKYIQLDMKDLQNKHEQNSPIALL